MQLCLLHHHHHHQHLPLICIQWCRRQSIKMQCLPCGNQMIALLTHNLQLFGLCLTRCVNVPSWELFLDLLEDEALVCFSIEYFMCIGYMHDIDSYGNYLESNLTFCKSKKIVEPYGNTHVLTLLRHASIMLWKISGAN